MRDRLPFEVVIPGMAVDLPDQEAAFQIDTQLLFVLNALADATMALVLFNDARSKTFAESRESEWQLEAELRAELAQSQPKTSECVAPGERARCQVESEQLLLREKWNRGMLPNGIRHRVAFMHAKSFVYAADEMGKILACLCERSDVPEDLAKLGEAFYASFPTLREVRNSPQHLEDRARGLGKGRKPLSLKPIDNGLVRSPLGGVLALNNLVNNRFGTTMADGHYGEVEVSENSLSTMRDHVERVLGAFQWRGPPRAFPG